MVAGVAVSMLAASTMNSCGPSRQPVIETERPEVLFPTNLTVEAHHERASLSWRTNRSDVPIQGYNIYIGEDEVTGGGEYSPKLSSVAAPFNSGIYPGDTNPSTDYETFEASGLTDGVHYYAAVTMVFADGRETRPSNMVEFVCHPSGTFSLRQSYSGERDGYSLSQSRSVRTDDLGNQIYYAQIEGEDYLLSPSRLDDVFQSVKFHPLSLESISDGFAAPKGPGSDKIGIDKGDTCLLETQSGQYAKILVRDFSGSGKDREVHLEYSFMPIPGYTDF